jgi:succinyl-CoA synthetase beta subunit/citryl-CoA synthetase large subunit
MQAMIIVEHEAKSLLKMRGLPLPAGEIIRAASDARRLAEAHPVVLKAQIPSGGRMKAGGVLFAESPQEAEATASKLLGAEVRGFPVASLLVEQKLTIAGEYFIAFSLDASLRKPVVIASSQGGIEVESVQEVVQKPFSLIDGFSEFLGREIAAELGLSGKALLSFAAIVTQLARCFLEWEAVLMECNPVVLDADGKWWIVDVHLELDDDALYRQKSILDAAPQSIGWAERRSDFEQKALDIDRADHRGVAGRLVPFDGNIGLLIGGGGASLTAMDAILDAGLSPANYCEIGGNPSVWKIKELTRLILNQPGVDQLVVIMNVVSNTRVDLVARGVIKGVLEAGHQPKEVIRAFRIPGSWEDEGYAILDHYGVPYFGREFSIDEVVAQIR